VLRSVANDAKRHPRKAARLDGNIDSFVGNEGRHNQQKVFRRDHRVIACWAVEVRIHRWIYDNGVPIIVPRDPGSNVLGNCDVTVYPARGGGVPPRQGAQRGTQQPVFHRTYASFAKVHVELVPGVAHRGEAVAEVLGLAGFDDRFCSAVARTDDEIVLIEIELFDDGRKERQAVAVKTLHSGDFLEHRSARPHSFDNGGDAARHVNKGEQVCRGIRLAQPLENFFAAAHPGQPIVNEDDALQDSTSP
jgi:hypothetical protein